MKWEISDLIPIKNITSLISFPFQEEVSINLWILPLVHLILQCKHANHSTKRAIVYVITLATQYSMQCYFLYHEQDLNNMLLVLSMDFIKLDKNIAKHFMNELFCQCSVMSHEAALQ